MQPDTYLSINEVCERFGLSRRTFYRMLADPRSGLAKVVVRIPPRTGRIRVPLKRFEKWLLERQ
ncbi:MAG: helix-turn-helix domain-containing protein [Planctomycetota bacterium]